MARQSALRNRRVTEAPTKITVGGTSAVNGVALKKGVYSLTSDVDVYFLQGDSTVTADSDSAPLWSKERAEVEVKADFDKDAYIAVIQQSAAGTLWITKLVS